MARALPPTIHDVKPDEINALVMTDQHLSVEFTNPATGVSAGAIYIAGADDRERLNNLLGIAQRLRCAALDLIADLANDPHSDWHRSTGQPTPLPGETPHGTTVARVRTEAERIEEHRRIDQARRAQYPAPPVVTA
jgi:hypothetical protein